MPSLCVPCKLLLFQHLKLATIFSLLLGNQVEKSSVNLCQPLDSCSKGLGYKHHKYQSLSRLSSTSTFANMSSKEPKPKAKSSGKRYACSHLSRLIQALTPSPIVKIWVGRSFDPHHMTHITINHNKNILHILLYTLAGPYLLVPVPVPVPVHHRSREGERERGPVLRLKR